MARRDSQPVACSSAIVGAVRPRSAPRLAASSPAVAGQFLVHPGMQSIDSGLIIKAARHTGLIGGDNHKVISSVQPFNGIYRALDPGEVLRAMKVCDVRVRSRNAAGRRIDLAASGGAVIVLRPSSPQTQLPWGRTGGLSGLPVPLAGLDVPASITCARVRR
jgi:hypothetical protein